MNVKDLASMWRSEIETNRNEVLELHRKIAVLMAKIDTKLQCTTQLEEEVEIK